MQMSRRQENTHFLNDFWKENIDVPVNGRFVVLKPEESLRLLKSIHVL
jgi:hypothetical protein